jgi:hypothetical protein
VDEASGVLDGLRWAFPRVVLLSPRGDVSRSLIADRRVHRFVLPDQPAARAWAREGATLGRVSVAEPGRDEIEALRAIWRESAAMARRPGVWEILRRRGRAGP